ncbi:MAG: hypothetical protein O4805_21020 [Trichodesmium sp. St16_bin2-tuft]|nr:hypothetical protein [Trichodesmium sp. St16_bin2-tuft]MDE5108134.1 hypothetical protein [Trichodesmium sp. St17_bin3_1_1]
MNNNSIKKEWDFENEASNFTPKCTPTTSTDFSVIMVAVSSLKHITILLKPC